MERRIISKSDYIFLEKELSFLYKQNLISSQQKDDSLEMYSFREFNFIKIVLIIGSLLVGLGIMTLIASNWIIITKPVKLLLIMGSFLSLNIISYKLRLKYIKTSKSLLYIGILVFGSGIFLIGQMFNYGGDFKSAFLLWAIGIAPMAYLLKDRIIFVFMSILFLLFTIGDFADGSITYIMFLIIPALYYVHLKFYNNKVVEIFFINLISISFLICILNKFKAQELYSLLIMFFIGILMYYLKAREYKGVFMLQGSFIIGITGIMLTYPNSWNIQGGVLEKLPFSTIFGIAFILLLLYLTHKNNLVALVFICLTIFRYYFDTLYNFMPKSLFFIIGGALLILFGFYFERKRVKNGGDIIEM